MLPAPLAPRKPPDPQRCGISRIELVALAGLTGFYFLFALGAYGLLNDNEGLYAEIAREMAAGASLVAPHLNGVPYLEKPPLLAWLVAALYTLFGPSEWASRAIPALSGIALVAGTFAFTARVRDELTALAAALMLASSLSFVMVTRTLMPDGLLICLFGLSMYLFYLWHAGRRRIHLVLCYALLGFAVLAKGFLALALGALTFLAFGATGPRTWRYAELLEPRALLAFLAVTVPWHILLAWHNFEFAWFYVYHEHVLRFLGLRRPQDYYTGPWYYYLPRIVVGLFPWSAFLPLFLTRREPASVPPDGLDRLLWAWFWVALMFFSVSRAKGNYYMLIAAAPLAILLAEHVAALIRADRRRSLAALTGALAAAGAVGVWAVASGAWMHRPHGLWITAFKLRDALLWSTAAFTAIAALAGVLTAMRRYRGALFALALASAPLLVFIAVMMQRADPFVSERALVRYLHARHAGEPVLVYRDFERLSSLPFYLKRPVAVVDSDSEDLLFGRPYAPPGTFLSDAQLAALSGRERVVLLVHRLRLRDFEARLGSLGLRPAGKIGNVTAYEN
ncbi:MAG: glycosyltransferase family 39 protein [Betaproteobacteria bacterium]|nr:glycosyltransferase family 39 protein [Betaproteobacteria bacterium]